MNEARQKRKRKNVMQSRYKIETNNNEREKKSRRDEIKQDWAK